MLIIAQTSIETIANFGFHSALIIEFSAIQIMKNGIHSAIILQYIVAYSLNASVHQNKFSSSGRNIKVIQQNNIEIIVVIKIQIATHLAPSSFFFSHSFILRKLAAQSQNKNAHQRHIIVKGNTMLVAQLARYHTHLPINI